MAGSHRFAGPPRNQPCYRLTDELVSLPLEQGFGAAVDEIDPPVGLGAEKDAPRPECDQPPLQWDEIKQAVSEVIVKLGGTITHHHAVGRDHRPWYDRQRPEGFARALKAAKRALDPHAILNPGVLIDP